MVYLGMVFKLRVLCFFVSMMQVSNFAGPKMGGPKTVIVGILDN